MGSNRPKTVFLTMIAVTAFACAFILAYHQDKTRAQSNAKRLALQLSPVLRGGDDLAVIDWTNSLESSTEILALRVVQGGKEIAALGETSRIEGLAEEGSSFRFPSLWITRYAEKKGLVSFQLSIAERLTPGPFLWGLLSLGVALVAAWPFRQKQHPFPERRVSALPPEGKVASFNPKTDPLLSKRLTEQPEGGILYMDERYRILWNSNKAAQLLQRKEETLVGLHLLDLNPSPELLAAIEEGKEGILSHPIQGVAIQTLKIEKAPSGLLLDLDTKFDD